jgi:hypothetical protein
LGNIHFSQTFFHPKRSHDKLYFDQPPQSRMEVLVPGRFIGDREIFQILREVVPKEYQIESLVQRQS